MVPVQAVEGQAGSIAGDGLDADGPAFFEMSVASAEQITLQIRSMMERAWEYVAVAYQGRAHIALGYESWDEYVDDRLGDLRLTVPREERGAVVQSLSRAQLSLRASRRSSVSTSPRCTVRSVPAIRPILGLGATERVRRFGVGMGSATRVGAGPLPRPVRSAVRCTMLGPSSARGTSSRRGEDLGRAARMIDPQSGVVTTKAPKL